MNKIILSFSLMALILACSGHQPSQAPANAEGEAIYKKYCTVCHGIDGKLGLNGSKDITVSKLTVAERIEQITNGKKTMTPFNGILSSDEIKAVAAYSMTLTKQ